MAGADGKMPERTRRSPPVAVAAAAHYAPRVNAKLPPRIRRAVAADLDTLVDLEERTFIHDRLSRAQYRRHLDSTSALVLVARLPPRLLLGSAVLFFRRNSRIARLYSLAIDENHRGLGVGRALVNACARKARQRGCERLRLEVRADNAVAIHLYEREGFRRVGLLPGFYENGSDAMRYEKMLR